MVCAQLFWTSVLHDNDNVNSVRVDAFAWLVHIVGDAK
jgi:hypothetical protein